MSKLDSRLYTTVLCNKTLTHRDGTVSFIKGNIYKGNKCNVLENLSVKNEQGEDHRLGGWSKHFTDTTGLDNYVI